MKTSNSLEHLVAIGASAGGLTPLQELVEALPENINNMAIVVAQHLSPEYKSMLTEIISRKSNIPTQAIQDQLSVEPNHIYITPPNCDVVVKNGLFVTSQVKSVGPRPSIDRLFSSIAKEYNQRAVGIILSGTGQDGSKGIVEMKKAGGVTICQHLESCKYTGMPQAAMTTGMVDVAMTPREIGENLTNIANSRKVNSGLATTRNESGNGQEDGNNQLKSLLNLLELKIGTDFNNYKESTIVRRLEKRMHDKDIFDIEEYLHFVNQNEDELDEFFRYLLIGVTEFFRDYEAFEALKKELIDVVKEKNKSEKMRIWVPGCATGEESVTIAILLHEIIEETSRLDLRYQIFATDINKSALRVARQGLYHEDKIAAIPNPLVDKYFIRHGAYYEVSHEIKQTILYTKHDLTINPPFQKLDLISCRNLFIYFKQQLQNYIFPIFQYALNPGGLLFLGKSETVGNHKNVFSPVNPKYRIFRKKDTNGMKSFRLPSTKPLQMLSAPVNKVRTRHDSMSIHDMVKETLYHTYEAPYVIIDDSMDIVEISGNTNGYLKIKPGPANMNLLRLTVEDLQIEVRSLITEAIKKMKIVRGNLKRFQQNSEKHLVRIMVKPLMYSNPKTPHFLVIFEPYNLVDSYFSIDNDHGKEHIREESMRNQELEYELLSNKQHMNTLVQELETTNEELQALNEELQSSNEELQASNEELETSNEELQATNEELENAYTELRIASTNLTRQKQLWEQLSITSPDLIAILRGEDFIIDFANPACKKLFPKKDLTGHPLMDVIPGMISKSCLKSINETRNTGKIFRQLEHPVSYDFNANGTKTKRYFNFTFAPLDIDTAEKNDIILYAVDITELINSRLSVENNARFFSALAESMPQMVWTVNENTEITYINETLRSYIGFTKKSPEELEIEKFIHKHDKEEYRNCWKKALKSKKQFILQYRLADHNGTHRWHLMKCTPLLNMGKKQVLVWVCTSTDIHEQKVIEEKKDEFMSIASHELKTPLTTVKAYIELLDEVIREKDVDTAAQYVNKATQGLNKIHSLVEDLLDMTRIQTGKLTFNKKKLEFDKIVREALEYAKPLTMKNKMIISGNTGVNIYGDAHRLEQVMINLIGNAVKYSKENDKIIVNTYRENGNVSFEVIDHGPGVPEQYRRKIFERFYRVKEKNDFTAGLGIGLYISKQIIRRHSGKIGVTDHESPGSKFYIKLPISE